MENLSPYKRRELLPQVTPPKKTETKTTKEETVGEIELLEIYVEKSRAIGLGQRLLWHLDKFNKKL